MEFGVIKTRDIGITFDFCSSEYFHVSFNTIPCTCNYCLVHGSGTLIFVFFKRLGMKWVKILYERHCKHFL
jgi:hypothetical protein